MAEKWFAVYTKPRWEKKVAEILTQESIKNYCPLNKVTRQWSDREKVVYAPLLPSYVFVQIQEKQLADLRKINGIINIVCWLGKPAVIKDEEIDIIRSFIKEHQNVRLEKAGFKVNETIKVTSGCLTDKEGTIVAVENNTIRVSLPSLGYIMHASIVNSSAVKIA